MKRVIKMVLFLFLASTVLLTACQKTKSEYEQRAQESEGSSLPIAKEKEVDALLLDPRNTLDVKQKSGVISSELYVDGAKICGMVSLDKEILLADHENGRKDTRADRGIGKRTAGISEANRNHQRQSIHICFG